MRGDWDSGNLLAYGVGGFERAAQSMVAILVPLWALQLHAPAPIIGLDVAAGALAPVVLSIPMGAAADRLGARRLMLAGALLAAATSALSAVPNYWLLALWQVFSGAGRAACWIGAQTIVTESGEGHGRTRRLGWLSLMAQIGNLTGPLVGGVLFARAGALAAFGVASGIMVVLVAGGLLLPGGPRPVAASAPPAGGAGDFRRALGLFGRPGIGLMAAGTAIRLALLGLKGSFYIVLLHRFGFGPALIGLVFSFASVVAAVAAPLAGAIERRVSNRWAVLGGLGVMAVSISATPFAPAVAAQLALMAVYGLGTGVTQPAIISLLARSTPPGERGLAIGLRTALNRVAQFAAPATFGVLAAWFALPVLFLGFGGVAAAGLVAAALRAGTGRPPARPAQG